jgi:hypothetical protein
MKVAPLITLTGRSDRERDALCVDRNAPGPIRDRLGFFNLVLGRFGKGTRAPVRPRLGQASSVPFPLMGGGSGICIWEVGIGSGVAEAFRPLVPYALRLVGKQRPPIWSWLGRLLALHTRLHHRLNLSANWRFHPKLCTRMIY